MRFFLIGLLLILATPLGVAEEKEVRGRFTPPSQRVLVFTGGDAESIGGTLANRDGYADNVMIPAGISQTIGMGESLNIELEQVKAYIDSPMLDRCLMHLMWKIKSDDLAAIAGGEMDGYLFELVEFVTNEFEHPFLIHLGPRFDDPLMGYDAELYSKAFHYIVSCFRNDNVPNVAFVYGGSDQVATGQYERFDPGEECYEWVGVEWSGKPDDIKPAIEFATKRNRPVFLIWRSQERDVVNWEGEVMPFFQSIGVNLDRIGAIATLGTITERLISNEGDSKRWRTAIMEDFFINASEKPFDLVTFPTVVQPIQLHAPNRGGDIYRDSDRSIKERVDDLVSKMNLEEKLAQISGWHEPKQREVRASGSIYRPDYYREAASHGLGAFGPQYLNIEEDIRQHYAMQEFWAHETRLGIPAFKQAVASHGLMRSGASSFPVPLSLSCSWNTQLVEEIYRQIGREAWSRGISQVLSPRVDITSNLRLGFVDDTLGENAFLAGKLGAAMVRGLQGRDDGGIAGDAVAATISYTAGSPELWGPDAAGHNGLFDREIGAFRRVVVDARPACLLPRFLPATDQSDRFGSWLMAPSWRNDLGFSGLVISDELMAPEFVAKSLDQGVHSGRSILNRGADPIPVDVASGQVNLATLDAAVGKLLTLKFRLGLFDGQKIDAKLANELVSSPETQALASKAARESLVLLKNDGILPLSKDVSKIAVIGPNSDVCRLGSFSGSPIKTVSLLDGIRSLVGEKVEVAYAKGCLFSLNDSGDSYLNWRYIRQSRMLSANENRHLFKEAVALAKDSDVVILALGEYVANGRRSLDKEASLVLPESQVVLAKQILAVGTPVVIYLAHGRPLILGDVGELANAILTGHYNGQATGTAAAEVLFGDYSPSGKLTVAWPKSEARIGGNEEPVYPFGHGESYTDFVYSEPTLSSSTLAEGGMVEVEFDLTNVGSREGCEVVQVYVGKNDTDAYDTRAGLKAFDRVELLPGETKTVRLKLLAEDFYVYHSDFRRQFPNDRFMVRIGGSAKSLSAPVELIIGEIDDRAASIEADMDEGEPLGEAVLNYKVSESRIKQTIDGFGGLVFGTEGIAIDEGAMEAVINGLNLTFLRCQGEVAANGDPFHNRELLKKAISLRPSLEVILTFFQPRSEELTSPDEWLEIVGQGGLAKRQLKPSMEGKWADEIINRTEMIRSWGIPVSAVAVQYQPNLSTGECYWEADRLANFIEHEVVSRIQNRGIAGLKIIGPELDDVGNAADEFDRYIPVVTSRAVDVISYQLYSGQVDSDRARSMQPLESNSLTLRTWQRLHFPHKRLWMTETHGIHWQREDRLPYGLQPGQSDIAKALKAARYLHTTIADAGANALFWGELMGDFGLVKKADDDSVQRDLAYYMMRHFSGFVQPGFQCVEVDSDPQLQVSAFISPDRDRLVSILINDRDASRSLAITPPDGMRLIGAIQTDENRNCSPCDAFSDLPARSVRTVFFNKTE